jgi:hypothetical protein
MSDLLAHPQAFHGNYNNRPLTKEFLIYLIKLFREDHANEWRNALVDAIHDWNGFFISDAPHPFDEIEPLPLWSETALELTVQMSWLCPHEFIGLANDLSLVADGKYRLYLIKLVRSLDSHRFIRAALKSQATETLENYKLVFHPDFIFENFDLGYLSNYATM